MKRSRVVLIVGLLALGTVVVVVSLTAASAADAPFLPGITVADNFPRGCVDCHKVSGSQDLTVNGMLKKLGEHPDVTKAVTTVPTDCAHRLRPVPQEGRGGPRPQPRDARLPLQGPGEELLHHRIQGSLPELPHSEREDRRDEGEERAEELVGDSLPIRCGAHRLDGYSVKPPVPGNPRASTPSAARGGASRGIVRPARTCP